MVGTKDRLPVDTINYFCSSVRRTLSTAIGCGGVTGSEAGPGVVSCNQMWGRAPPVTNGGMWQRAILRSSDMSCRLASEVGIWQTHFTWRRGCGGLKGSSGRGRCLDSTWGMDGIEDRPRGSTDLV
jgi:hypothetical protein